MYFILLFFLLSLLSSSFPCAVLLADIDNRCANRVLSMDSVVSCFKKFIRRCCVDIDVDLCYWLLFCIAPRRNENERAHANSCLPSGGLQESATGACCEDAGTFSGPHDAVGTRHAHTHTLTNRPEVAENGRKEK